MAFERVLSALLWSFHNSRDGRCFPGYERIAEQARCARSTVAEALKALEWAGVLTWQHRIVRVRERCTTEIPLDTIDDVLAHVADAARCWEVNPSIYNDRRLTQLVEQAQEAIARTCPTTETTLRLLQHITPKGLKLAIIQCEGSGAPLIAISIDADQTLRRPEAARLDAPPAVVAGRLSGYARKVVPFMAGQ
jgi:hypothetical protein